MPARTTRRAVCGPTYDRLEDGRSMGWTYRYGAGLVAALALLVATACEPGEPEWTLPTEEEVSARYGAGVEASVRGNVVQLDVDFRDDLRRGGPLWAMSGPYFYLFSSATRSLFTDYPDLAGVRVVTRTTGQEEVARALLRRDAMTERAWQRGLNIAARAQMEGTERPGLLRDLVRWGEDHTDYEYSEEFVGR
jgi:hypothetical protein